VIVVLTIHERRHCCVVSPTCIQVQRWLNFCASRPTSTMGCESVRSGRSDGRSCGQMPRRASRLQ
jgi:hypothetical protein